MIRVAFSLVFTLLASFSSFAAAAEPATQPAPQTGAFETTFTHRSPQSGRPELIDRLAEKDIGPEYDLSQQPFFIYVPPDYSPDKPLGIVVYMTGDGATKAPSTIQPILNTRHLIFIMAKK